MELLKNKVGPGSKVPLKVVVKNNENFYLPVTLYLTKGPSEVKDNTIGFLLRPNSKESALFLLFRSKLRVLLMKASLCFFQKLSADCR